MTALLQKPFSDVEYRVIGDGTAPTYFALDSASGQVSVRNGVDLPADTSINYNVGQSFDGADSLSICGFGWKFDQLHYTSEPQNPANIM